MPKGKKEGVKKEAGKVYQVPVVVQGLHPETGKWVVPTCVPLTFRTVDVSSHANELFEEWLDLVGRRAAFGGGMMLRGDAETDKEDMRLRVSFHIRAADGSDDEVMVDTIGGFWKEVRRVVTSDADALWVELVADLGMGEEEKEEERKGGSAGGGGGERWEGVEGGDRFLCVDMKRDEEEEGGEEVGGVEELVETETSQATRALFQSMSPASPVMSGTDLMETPSRHTPGVDDDAMSRASMPRVFQFPSRAATPVERATTPDAPGGMTFGTTTFASRLLRKFGHRDKFRVPGERTLMRTCEWSQIQVTGSEVSTRIWWCNSALGRVGLYDPVRGVPRTLVAGLSRPTRFLVLNAPKTEEDAPGVLVVLEASISYPGAGRVIGVQIQSRDLDVAMPRRRILPVILADEIHSPRTISAIPSDPSYLLLIHVHKHVGDQLFSRIPIPPPHASVWTSGCEIPPSPLQLLTKRPHTIPGTIVDAVIVPMMTSETGREEGVEKEAIVLAVNMPHRHPPRERSAIHKKMMVEEEEEGGGEDAIDGDFASGSLEVCDAGNILLCGDYGDDDDDRVEVEFDPLKVVRRLPVISHLASIRGYLDSTKPRSSTSEADSSLLRTALMDAKERDRMMRKSRRVLPLLYISCRSAAVGDLICPGLLALHLPLAPAAAGAVTCLRTGRVHSVGVDDDGHVYLITFLRNVKRHPNRTQPRTSPSTAPSPGATMLTPYHPHSTPSTSPPPPPPSSTPPPSSSRASLDHMVATSRPAAATQLGISTSVLHVYHSSRGILAGARRSFPPPTSPAATPSPPTSPTSPLHDMPHHDHHPHASPEPRRRSPPSPTKSEEKRGGEIAVTRSRPRYCLTIAARPREVRRRSERSREARTRSGRTVAANHSLLVLGGALPTRTPGSIRKTKSFKINIAHHEAAAAAAAGKAIDAADSSSHSLSFPSAPARIPKAVSFAPPGEEVEGDGEGVELESGEDEGEGEEDGDGVVLWGDDRAEEAGDVREEPVKLQVVARCRPRIEREVESEAKEVIKVVNDRFVHVKEYSEHSLPKQYEFARAFGPEQGQADVFREAVLPLVAKAVGGYDATVFAFGQTSSGKTYTLEGKIPKSSEDDLPRGAGIAPRAVFSMFEMLDATTTSYVVTVSHLEIYNEELGDLLSPHEIGGKGGRRPSSGRSSRPSITAESEDTRGSTSTLQSPHHRQLRLRMDESGRLEVVGLTERTVIAPEDIIDILRTSQRRRHTHETLLNKASSRSHAVLTIKIDAVVDDPSTDRPVRRRGRLNLVDLSGSENIRRSGSTGARLAEAGMINRGLLALGRVVKSIVERAPHIPYRDSKLTRVLEPALGGGSCALMILTIGPTLEDADETVSTLNYAHAARHIINKPQRDEEEVVEEEESEGSSGDEGGHLSTWPASHKRGRRSSLLHSKGVRRKSGAGGVEELFSPWTMESDGKVSKIRPWEGIVPLVQATETSKRRQRIRVFEAEERGRRGGGDDAVEWARDWFFNPGAIHPSELNTVIHSGSKLKKKGESVDGCKIHLDAVAATAYLFNTCDVDGNGRLDMDEARVLSQDMNHLILLEAARRYAEGEGRALQILRSRRAGDAALQRKKQEERMAAVARAREAARMKASRFDPFADWHASKGLKLTELGVTLPRVGGTKSSTKSLSTKLSTTTPNPHSSATSSVKSHTIASSTISTPASSTIASTAATPKPPLPHGALFHALSRRITNDGVTFLLFDEVVQHTQHAAEEEKRRRERQRRHSSTSRRKAATTLSTKKARKVRKEDDVEEGDAALMRLERRGIERIRQDIAEEANTILSSRHMIASVRRPMDPHILAQANPPPGSIPNPPTSPLHLPATSDSRTSSSLPSFPTTFPPPPIPDPGKGRKLWGRLKSHRKELANRTVRDALAATEMKKDEVGRGGDGEEEEEEDGVWLKKDIEAVIRLAKKLGWTGEEVKGGRKARKECLIDLPGFVRWMARVVMCAPAMARILVDAGYLAMVRTREKQEIVRETSQGAEGGRSTIPGAKERPDVVIGKLGTKPVHLTHCPQPYLLETFFVVGGEVAEGRKLLELMEDTSSIHLRNALYVVLEQISRSPYATDYGLPRIASTLTPPTPTPSHSTPSSLSTSSSSTTHSTTTFSKEDGSGETIAARLTYAGMQRRERLRLLRLRRRYRNRHGIVLPKVEEAEAKERRK